MEPSVYFLALLTSALGIFCGVVISLITKEELDEGERYFVFAKKFLLGLMLGTATYVLSANVFLALAVLIATFYLVNFVRLSEYIAYPLLGIVFFVGSHMGAYFIILSTLVFFYGFPSGSIITKKLMKKGWLNCALRALGLAGLLIISAGLFYALEFGKEFLKP